MNDEEEKIKNMKDFVEDLKKAPLMATLFFLALMFFIPVWLFMGARKFKCKLKGGIPNGD